MLLNTREHLELDKLLIENRKLRVETRKFEAELRKLEREAQFYPLVASAAAVSALVAVFNAA